MRPTTLPTTTSYDKDCIGRECSNHQWWLDKCEQHTNSNYTWTSVSEECCNWREPSKHHLHMQIISSEKEDFHCSDFWWKIILIIVVCMMHASKTTLHCLSGCQHKVTTWVTDNVKPCQAEVNAETLNQYFDDLEQAGLSSISLWLPFVNLLANRGSTLLHEF